MKRKVSFQKINSIHFGLPWICIGAVIGIVIPLLIYFVFDIFCWLFCILGGVVLLAFGIVFAIEMHQDFGKVPYYKKRLAEAIPFDEAKQCAVIKCSICNGEQVAGFRNKEDGTFIEVMVINSADDLEYFKRIYNIDKIVKEY